MSGLFPFEFISRSARFLLLQGVIIVFLLLNVVNFSLPHTGDFKPFFLLMAVYYWSVYRPTVIPVAYTFALGVLLDLLTHMPPGMSALILLAVQHIVRKSRLFLMGQSYITVWLGYAVTAVFYAAAFWFFVTVWKLSFPPPVVTKQVMIAVGFSILLFPLASLLLRSTHRLLPTDSGMMRSVR